MQIEVLQENLVKALAVVTRFVANKPSLPILSMILVEVKEGKVVMVGTNMDTGVEVELAAKVIKEGAVALPAKLMHEYVNLLPAGKVSIEVVEKGMVLKAGGKVAKVSVVAADDFPEMPKFETKNTCKIKSDDWQRLVRLVKFSASTDPARPVLSALLFDFSREKGVRVVATDGYRLSLMDGLIVSGGLEVEKVLVPSTVVEEVGRLVKDLGEEDLELVYSLEQKSLAFVVGGVWVVSRLVEGDFPAYERILPKEVDLVVKINKDDLLLAIKAASVFARDGSHIVSWEIVDGELKVSASAANVGEQESVLGVTVVEGSEGTISFNSRFLMELLGRVNEEEIDFGMTGELQPGRFVTKEKGFLHVIMPVRTQGK